MEKFQKMLYDYKGLLKSHTIRSQPKTRFDDDLWTQPTNMAYDQRPDRLRNENYHATMDAALRVNFQVNFFLFPLYKKKRDPDIEPLHKTSL